MKPRPLPSRPASAALAPGSRPRPGGIVVAAACAAALAAVPAFGQVATTLNGPPVQVRPYVPEPGLPEITIPQGTPNPFPSDPTSSGPSGDGSGDGSGGGGSSGGGGIVASSDALSTMLGTPWGAAAVANAQALGVNPSALAATCVVESGCQNVGGSGTIAGAFQMSASTYTAMINAALAQNPGLASQIVPGLAGQMDPATESIAASEYLAQGAQYLQAKGISDPSVLDVRGYYNFGPANGASLAQANASDTVASAMPNVSATTLAANGITPGETVGQWRASVSSKIGNAAGQSVLS